MKPALVILGLGLSLFLGLPLAAQEDSGLPLYFVYRNPCELCKEEEEFLALFNRLIRDIQNRPRHHYRAFNLFKTDSQDRFAGISSRLGINPDNLPMPILIIGDEYLAGVAAIREGVRDLYQRQALAFTVSGASADPGAPESAPGLAAGKAAAPPASKGPGYFSRYSPEDPAASVMICFVTTACESCEKAKSFLEELPETVDLASGERSPLKIRYANISDGAALAELRRFFGAYAVPEEDQMVPVIFFAQGYLGGYENIRQGLGEVLRSGRAQGFSYPETDAPVQSFTWAELPGIALAGLVGGVNPCSISMLLLLLSLLAAKGAHILALGFSYVASRMFTYLVLGLSLFSLGRVLESGTFRSLQGAARIVLAGAALVLCALNLADFVNARRENYGAIKVQLPKALRRFNHRIIQKTLEGNPRFLAGAVFLLGMVVSAGEFLCTGQVYLAAILYLLRTDTGNYPLTLTAFLCYTLMAALPPAVLVILCYRGKRAMALSDFIREKMPLIKLANAALFALFAFFTLFF
jgi:glutaredoxin